MNTKFKNSSTGDKVFIILVYVLLSAVMLIVLYPLIYIISASFSDPQAVVSGKVVLWPVDVTLRGYKAVFKNPKIITGFINSFIYMGVGTVVNLIMTMLCAYPLSERVYSKKQDCGIVRIYHVFLRRSYAYIYGSKQTWSYQHTLGNDHSKCYVHLQYDHRTYLYGKLHSG